MEAPGRACLKRSVRRTWRAQAGRLPRNAALCPDCWEGGSPWQWNSLNSLAGSWSQKGFCLYRTEIWLELLWRPCFGKQMTAVFLTWGRVTSSALHSTLLGGDPTAGGAACWAHTERFNQIGRFLKCRQWTFCLYRLKTLALYSLPVWHCVSVPKVWF